MANVTLAANKEVCDLLDYEYVEHQLGDLKVNILFAPCLVFPHPNN
jgi:hypothetical protein